MAEPKWLDARELAAWEGYLEVSTMLNRRVEQQLKDDAGLSHPQYEVLARLSGAPGGELRMTELAGAALTSKSGLTYQVAQLEKSGLVKRRTCESDERGVIATLTEAGWRKLRESAPGHVGLVRELFLDGLTGKQFTAFAEGLDAIRRRLRDKD
ncbi:MarR family winged helix-turn-helix transcriptional regulator [Umezawaea tangerina]|uniref:DNA-binding MarR family transcriptional regulator n=1 Tax=Umezawaea tangerina TaxID=84725 RepID=A0A2T0SE20_9PSEU|nr:MarR family transcriptional regulator [Umezawaea tangerina]PRY31650.1 DNA-binding MarR family transcriptional regulator [Umezawaea tangerina]